MKRGSRKFKKIKTRIKTRINKGFKRSRLTKKRRRNVNTKKRRRNMHGGGNGLDSRYIMSLPEDLRSWAGEKLNNDMFSKPLSKKNVTFYLDNIRKGDENYILFTLKWFPTGKGITSGRFIDMKYNLSSADNFTISDYKTIFDTKGINKEPIDDKVNNIFSKKINDEDIKPIIESILEIPDKIKELEKNKKVFTKFRTSLEYLKVQINVLKTKKIFETIIDNYANHIVKPKLIYTDDNINDVINEIIAKANELLEKLSFKLDYLLNKKKLIGLSLDWDGCCAPYFLKIGKDDSEQFIFIENIINKIDEKTNNTASNVLIFVGSNRQSRDIDNILKRSFSHSKSALEFFNNNIEKLFNQNTRNKHSKNDRISPHIFKFMKGLISDNPQMFKLDTDDKTFKSMTVLNQEDLTPVISEIKKTLPLTNLNDDKNILSLYGNEIQNTTEVDYTVKNVSNHPFNFNSDFITNKINRIYEQDLKMWLNVYHMKKLIDLTTNIPIDIEYIFLDDRQEFLNNLLNKDLLRKYSNDVADKFANKISCIKIDTTNAKNQFEEISFPPIQPP